MYVKDHKDQIKVRVIPWLGNARESKLQRINFELIEFIRLRIEPKHRSASHQQRFGITQEEGEEVANKRLVT